MRPWLGLLLLAGLVFGAQALPPIITVKNLKTKSGPAYKWSVVSRVPTPLAGPLYPDQTGVAKVTVDIQRTSAGKGYVVSGKIIVTNPSDNTEVMPVTAVKVSFEPVVPLLTPLPQQLDCPQKELGPGESLSCSFKVDLTSNIVTTLTPLVHVRNLPQMQGQPLQLSWPSEEEQQPVPGEKEAPPENCVLVQNQLIAGDLQSLVKITTSQDGEDMLQSGLEVCSDSTTVTYNVEVGPFSNSSELCGLYTIKDLPTVRLAAGSIGGSSVTHLALPVTISGCRQKDLLGGHKPAVAITKLTLAKLITHEWSANTSSTTNTSSPAAVDYAAKHAIDVQVVLKRTDGTVQLLLMGEVTITNTQKYPFVLPAQGVRMVLTKADSKDTEFVPVTCPLVGNNIVIKPMTDTPSTLVCEFKMPIDAAWGKGTIQAQLQTLLSASYEVDSGLPKSYNFDEAASVQRLYQSECVSVQLTRVTNPVDLQSANRNPAVASLARKLGGEKFKLIAMGQVMAGPDGRVPPAATETAAAPLVVCGDDTVAWREAYGPWTEYDCGPNMALMGLSAKPLSGPAEPVTATLAFPIAVQSCTIKPTIVSMQLRASSQESHSWSVTQTRTPSGDISVPRQKALPLTYHVEYKPSSSVSGFRVHGMFKVVNPHAATLSLDQLTYSISRPTGAPITGEADCSGTTGDPYSNLDVAVSTNTPVLPSKHSKYKLATTKAGKAAKKDGPERAIVSTASYGSDNEADDEFEEGGSGPLFCSFDVKVPDDYPAVVSVTAVTEEGVRETVKLGTLDWPKIEHNQANKCALASFSFSNAGNLIQPSSIDGHAPPALAVKICEPKKYSFKANFGPWLGYGAQCGSKQALSIATISTPATATVVNSEELVHIDVTGCPEPLPIVSVDAGQTPIKGTYIWTITRRMTPVGSGHKNADPAMTVAGPGSSTSEVAVLALSAKHNAGSQPGAYAKFNQTVIVRRTKPEYDEGNHMYEIKGEVKLANTANTPLRVKKVVVKIVCDSGAQKPITVTATCPQHYYKSEYAEASYLTIPTTAGPDDPVKCKFGTVLPGPGAVSVHGVAIMRDGRKSKGKHSVHLNLRPDFFKPSTLGSCIRVRERQVVRDSLTGANAHNLLNVQGHRIPEDGVELCKTKTYSFIGRIGPLESYKSQGCQAVSYESRVEGMPSSGYQGKLRNGGVVEVHTKSCKAADEGDGSEDTSKTYKGNDYGKYKPGGADKSYKGSGWEDWDEANGLDNYDDGSDSLDDFDDDGGYSSGGSGSGARSAFPPLPGKDTIPNPAQMQPSPGGGFPSLPNGGSSSTPGGSSGGPGGSIMPPLPSSSGGGGGQNYLGGAGDNAYPSPGSSSGGSSAGDDDDDNDDDDDEGYEGTGGSSGGSAGPPPSESYNDDDADDAGESYQGAAAHGASERSAKQATKSRSGFRSAKAKAKQL